MKIIKIICLSALIAVIPLYCLRNYYTSRTSADEIIEHVMNYSMTDITKRCQKDYGYTDEDIKILEKELKRYLILAMLSDPHTDGYGMYSKDVDNLWHSFILFTKNYSDFCAQNNGKFIHHIPRVDETRTPEQLAESRRDFCKFIKNYEELFKEEMHPIWFLDIYENV